MVTRSGGLQPLCPLDLNVGDCLWGNLEISSAIWSFARIQVGNDLEFTAGDLDCVREFVASG
jgi:hypothetical protein